MTLADAYSPFSKIFNVRDVITFATTSSLISLVISYDRFFSFSFFFFFQETESQNVFLLDPR